MLSSYFLYILNPRHSVLVVPTVDRGYPPAFWLPAARGSLSPPVSPVGDDETQLDAATRVLAGLPLPAPDRIYASSLSLPTEGGAPGGTAVFVAIMQPTADAEWHGWPDPGRRQVEPEMAALLDRVHDRFLRSAPDEALRVG